jgi:hypothetical protein
MEHLLLNARGRLRRLRGSIRVNEQVATLAKPELLTAGQHGNRRPRVVIALTMFRQLPCEQRLGIWKDYKVTAEFVANGILDYWKGACHG